jgi:hypothetical protein
VTVPRGMLLPTALLLLTVHQAAHSSGPLLSLKGTAKSVQQCYAAAAGLTLRSPDSTRPGIFLTLRTVLSCSYDRGA